MDVDYFSHKAFNREVNCSYEAWDVGVMKVDLKCLIDSRKATLKLWLEHVPHSHHLPVENSANYRTHAHKNAENQIESDVSFPVIFELFALRLYFG